MSAEAGGRSHLLPRSDEVFTFFRIAAQRFVVVHSHAAGQAERRGDDGSDRVRRSAQAYGRLWGIDCSDKLGVAAIADRGAGRQSVKREIGGKAGVVGDAAAAEADRPSRV